MNKCASNGKLPLGAYLLEAKSGSLSARDLVLVTDASLVVKSSAKQALVYFSNALTGAPIANANVTLWESYYDNNKWHWRKLRQTTNSDGLAPFPLKNPEQHRKAIRSRRQYRRCESRSPGFRRRLCQWQQRWRRVAHLRLHRSPRLSTEGNRPVEIHRAPFWQWRLFNSGEPGGRISDQRSARHEGK